MSETTTLPPLRPIHPFPARMAPAIVWEELVAASTEINGPNLRVLDPMAGSGTTITMARLLGHCAIGFDTDPLAVLIARAWSSNINPSELETAAGDVVQTASKIVPNIDPEQCYPDDADEETRRFATYWFDEASRRELRALSATILDFENASLRPLLWCALSRLIIVKSAGVSLAIDVSHSRPHRVYDTAPIRPLSHFQRAAKIVARHAPFSEDLQQFPTADVREGDARTLALQDGSVDFVITSPPYLNAIDYLRGHKLSLIWMGHTVASLRKIRATNVGTELSSRIDGESHIEAALSSVGDIGRLSARDVGMLRRYVLDMDIVMAEITRVLTPVGRVVLVVGDSTLHGVFIQNSKMLELLGTRHGLELINMRRRPLPPNRRYLPPPCAEGAGKKLETRMRDEVILSFSRQPA